MLVITRRAGEAVIVDARHATAKITVVGISRGVVAITLSGEGGLTFNTGGLGEVTTPLAFIRLNIDQCVDVTLKDGSVFRAIIVRVNARDVRIALDADQDVRFFREDAPCATAVEA